MDNTRLSLLTAALVENADEYGVIRLNSRELIELLQTRNIMPIPSARIAFYPALRRLAELGIITRFHRHNRKRIRYRLGKDYFLRVGDRQSVLKALDSLPRVADGDSLLQKLNAMRLDEEVTHA